MVEVMLLRLVLYAPVLAIGGIIMVSRTDTSMSWIIFIAVAVIIGVVLVLMKFSMPKFKMMQKLVDRLNLVSREILTGIPVIRAFSREEHEKERFQDANTALMETQLYTSRMMAWMMPIMMLIMNCITIAVVWFGAKGIAAGQMQVGDMMAFITYAMVIVMSFLLLTMMSIMLPRAGVAAERIQEVLCTKSSIEDAKTVADDTMGQIRGELASHDVCFAYPNAKSNVLDHLDFVAEPGKTTAIIGSTGCGKSTLLQLIPRLYDVTEGSINVPYLLTYVLKDEYLIGLYEKKLVYTIPDDLTDREYRVSMQYGNFGEFRNLSPDFLEVLKIMAMEITGDKPGNVKLALKYAKEGKNIEKHNILEQHFRKKRDK